jgi:hypothetical protein
MSIFTCEDSVYSGTRRNGGIISCILQPAPHLLGVDASLFGCYDLSTMKNIASYYFYFGFFGEPPESQLVAQEVC